MPDISMCPGTDCPMSETCYRCIATPNKHWQAWTDFSRFLKEEKDGTVTCEFYMEAE